MPVTRPAELGLVMMPWYTMIGLFVVASPVIVLAGAAARARASPAIFLLAAVAYFLTYETLHALYHLPDDDAESPGRRPLRASSARCRRTTRTTTSCGGWPHVNFNVTIPLMDWVWGRKSAATNDRDPQGPAPRDELGPSRSPT